MGKNKTIITQTIFG